MKVYKTEQDQEFMTEERCQIIEIINEADRKDISLAQARVAPGIRTQLHALEGTEEIYYILEGSGLMTIESEMARLSKGDGVVISPGQAQTIFNDGAEDLIFLCICRPGFKPSCYTNLEK